MPKSIAYHEAAARGKSVTLHPRHRFRDYCGRLYTEAYVAGDPPYSGWFIMAVTKDVSATVVIRAAGRDGNLRSSHRTYNGNSLPYGFRTKKLAEEFLQTLKEFAMTTDVMELLIDGYIQAACFAETDGDGNELQRDKLAPETIKQMEDDVRKFFGQSDVWQIVADSPEVTCRDAGRDLWFSRCGHGTGFFDEDGYADAPDGTRGGDYLQKQAHKTGARWLYVGDDGQIYMT